MNGEHFQPRGKRGFIVASAITAATLTCFVFLTHAQEQNGNSEKNTSSMIENKEKSGGPAGKQWSDAELHQRLSPEQYYVTRNNGTEPPFRNAYWDNHRAGLYVDVVSGEPLFSSMDKFESGTGWPSFTKPVTKEHVIEKTDGTLGMARTEVRSRDGNSHLGHLFDDGPAPTGMRYCINSAALRFVPVEKLEAEGYGEYLPLFEKK